MSPISRLEASERIIEMMAQLKDDAISEIYSFVRFVVDRDTNYNVANHTDEDEDFDEQDADFVVEFTPEDPNNPLPYGPSRDDKDPKDSEEED